MAAGEPTGRDEPDAPEASHDPSTPGGSGPSDAPYAGTDGDDPVLSAGVLLSRSPTATPGAATDDQWVLDRLAGLGFAVTEPFGPTFSMTGATSLFCRVFPSAQDDIRARGSGATRREVALPVGDLSHALATPIDDVVAAIFFTADPDYGP